MSMFMQHGYWILCELSLILSGPGVSQINFVSGPCMSQINLMNCVLHLLGLHDKQNFLLNGCILIQKNHYNRKKLF